MRFSEGLADPVDVDDYVIYPRRDGWTFRGASMNTAIVDTEGQTPLYRSNEHMFGEYVHREDMAKLYRRLSRVSSPLGSPREARGPPRDPLARLREYP